MYFIFINDWTNTEDSKNFSIFSFDLHECPVDFGAEITLLGLGIGVIFIKGFNDIQ